MPTQKQLTQTFDINVKIRYMGETLNDEDSDQVQYLFGYTVHIKNLSPTAAQLLSRHWIITDGFGRTEEVRGAGVVGVQPNITPGQTFEYESMCPLSTQSGSMRGSYQMISASGEVFDIEIPEFYLITPNSLH